MTRLQRIIETALYVDDLDRAAAFYEGAMALKHLLKAPTLFAYDVGGASVLLLFRRGASNKTQVMPGGTIPPHDGAGRIHMCFAIDADDLDAWEQRLDAHGITIEGRTNWGGGGRSVYFRDPDGHLLELATPGLWRIY